MGLSRIFADFVFHCLASQKTVAVIEPCRNSGKSVTGANWPVRAIYPDKRYHESTFENVSSRTWKWASQHLATQTFRAPAYQKFEEKKLAVGNGNVPCTKSARNSRKKTQKLAKEMLRAPTCQKFEKKNSFPSLSMDNCSYSRMGSWFLLLLLPAVGNVFNRT